MFLCNRLDPHIQVTLPSAKRCENAVSHAFPPTTPLLLLLTFSNSKISKSCLNTGRVLQVDLQPFCQSWSLPLNDKCFQIVCINWESHWHYSSCSVDHNLKNIGWFIVFPWPALPALLLQQWKQMGFLILIFRTAIADVSFALTWFRPYNVLKSSE